MKQKKKNYVLPSMLTTSGIAIKEKRIGTNPPKSISDKYLEAQKINKVIQEFLRKSIAKMEEAHSKVRKDYPVLFD